MSKFTVFIYTATRIIEIDADDFNLNAERLLLIRDGQYIAGFPSRNLEGFKLEAKDDTK